MSEKRQVLEPEFSENAIAVLQRRYLRKDATGKPIETANDMFWRVARNIALMDMLYDSRVYSGKGPGTSSDKTGSRAVRGAKTTKEAESKARKMLLQAILKPQQISTREVPVLRIRKPGYKV